MLPLNCDDGHSARAVGAEHGAVERELAKIAIVAVLCRDRRENLVVRIDVGVRTLDLDRVRGCLVQYWLIPNQL